LLAKLEELGKKMLNFNYSPDPAESYGVQWFWYLGKAI